MLDAYYNFLKHAGEPILGDKQWTRENITNAYANSFIIAKSTIEPDYNFLKHAGEPVFSDKEWILENITNAYANSFIIEEPVKRPRREWFPMNILGLSNYAITVGGKCKNIKLGHKVNGSLHWESYQIRFTLTNDQGKSIDVCQKRLVALMFLPPPSKPCNIIRQYDRDTRNCHVSNLYWDCDKPKREVKISAKSIEIKPLTNMPSLIIEEFKALRIAVKMKPKVSRPKYKIDELHDSFNIFRNIKVPVLSVKAADAKADKKMKIITAPKSIPKRPKSLFVWWKVEAKRLIIWEPDEKKSLKRMQELYEKNMDSSDEE